MGLLRLLTNDPLAFALVAIPLLFSVIIHEVAHGWVAYRMGDPTAKWLGRLSLNPLKHLDPIGTLMLFLCGFRMGETGSGQLQQHLGQAEGTHLRLFGRDRRKYPLRLLRSVVYPVVFHIFLRDCPHPRL